MMNQINTATRDEKLKRDWEDMERKTAEAERIKPVGSNPDAKRLQRAFDKDKTPSKGMKVSSDYYEVVDFEPEIEGDGARFTIILIPK